MAKRDGKTGASDADALWYTGNGCAAIRRETLAPLAPGHLRVEALYSGISRGTESLVFNGQVPESEFERMRAPFQAGDFPFPVKYGYACVGRIVAGPDDSGAGDTHAGDTGADDTAALLPGRTVFVLHPHQTLFDIPVNAARIVPDHIPPQRAVLGANMETALNALWDGGLAPGDHIAVVGGGVIGALTAWLASRTPGTRVTLVDKNPDKARVARKLGLAFSDPENTRGDNDLVIHASASETGLNTAIGLCGMEATVVEMSWYGEKSVRIGLGGAFHARRLKLISSQVGQIPPARRPRWDYARRLAAAIRLLDDPCLDALLEEPVAFADLPHCLPTVLAPGAATLCQVVRYPAAASVTSDID